MRLGGIDRQTISMKIISLGLTALLAITVIHAQNPSLDPPALPMKPGPLGTHKSAKTFGPARIDGGRFHYADNHADYIYRFGSDGTYNVTWVHKGGTDPGYREGKFTWRRSGTQRATLDLGDERWSLEFDQANRAAAHSSDDARPYIWFWEK